jgi:ketosteroid isomerase-like protein
MHPNEALARQELELIKAGGGAVPAELYADDFVLHYPGRNPLAGDHSLAGFVEAIGSLLGEDGTVTRELHDVFGSDEHAVQLLNVTADAKGRSHSWQAAVVYHVRDGRFSEAWISIRDQHALDDFLNSLG